jgi:hypothetical protein
MEQLSIAPAVAGDPEKLTCPTSDVKNERKGGGNGKSSVELRFWEGVPPKQGGYPGFSLG